MKNSSKDAGKQLRSFEFYPLEDRVLLNGDAIIEVDASAIDSAEIDLANIELALYDLQIGPDGLAACAGPVDAPASGSTSPSNNDVPSSDTSGDSTDDPAIEINEPRVIDDTHQNLNTPPSLDLIFVDSRAANADAEIARLTSDTSHDWLVIRLDANADSLQQISETLGQHHDVSSIHLIGEIKEGSYQLGANDLDLHSLMAYSGEIATWSDSLDSDAEIVLHGMDEASLNDFQYLTDGFATLCDREVVTGDEFWHSTESSRTVVFVDYRVQDSDTLLVGLGLQDADIYYIDEGVDGIAWMSDILAQYDAQSIDTLQVLSHGGVGTILLGNTELTSESLQQYASSIQNWQQSLTSDADILIFGCDVATDLNGKLLVDQISVLTGADVAASTDKTGSESLGGNWQLEYETGYIHWNQPASTALASYQYILAEGTSGANFLIGSSVTETHNGYAGNDLLVGGNNLASNGQFLSSTAGTNYTNGQSLGSWTVTAASVDVIPSGTYTSPTGGLGLDMDGNSTGGAIAQTFTTVVGNTYVVRFMATTNSSGIATTKGLEMTVGGFSTDFLISTTSASTGASPEWSERTYTFVATSTSTTLQFRSLSTSGTAGAVISDIAVADVTANNGNDTLNGGDNDDTIIGSGGNDIIDGGNGNDLIFGGGGTNTINGGAGTDIVMFSGNRGNYSVTVSGANYIVTDLRTGAPDGTSTITNVETFRFTDGDLTPVQASLRTPIFESFEDSSLTGWTGGAIVSSDTNFSSILTSATSSGSPATNASSLGIVGTQDVFKTFSLSGNQNSVTIAFTFNRIDSWDGENFIVWVNDVAVSTRAYSGNATSNYADTTSDSSSGTNLGYQGTWDEEIVTYVLTVNTSATSLKLGFGSSVDQNWNDEAWGVDNLSIREQITATTTGTYSEGTTAGDTLNGTSLYDSYAGGVGNDTLTGAAGSDYLSGGHGTDSVDGGTGNDIVVGGWGADTLAGGLGSDSMDGGEGADFIYGGGLQILSNTWSSGGNVSSISTQGSTEGTNALAFGTATLPTRPSKPNGNHGGRLRLHDWF